MKKQFILILIMLALAVALTAYFIGSLDSTTVDSSINHSLNNGTLQPAL